MPAERILILGGTRDARELAGVLTGRGHAVITSLAGVTQAPELPVGEHRIGGFGGVDGMAKYVAADAISVVVDATHPFAARISHNAHSACLRTGTPLLRLERPAWRPGPGDRWTDAAAPEVAALLLPPGARVLLTTGRKDVAPFFSRADISGIARMIEEPPLDPPPNWRVVRERPPFSLTQESVVMRENAITHLVTKNAGGSATAAKLAAAREQGIAVVMIARPAKPEAPCFAEIGALAAAVERLLSP